jgi:hypothetical protein
MPSLSFHALAAARGDGLRPELRAMLERLAKGDAYDIAVRADGLLQAGPDPLREIVNRSQRDEP